MDKKSIQIVFPASGDFTIDKGIIRSQDGEKFFTELMDSTLLVSSDDLSNNGSFSSLGNGNISVIGNTNNVSGSFSNSFGGYSSGTVTQNDVTYQSKGNKIFITSRNNKDIYFNGELLSANSSKEESIDEAMGDDNRVKEYDISQYLIESILISGTSRVSADYLPLDEYADIKISGSGSFDCASFSKNITTDIKISGSGDITLYGLVSNIFMVKISGSGDIRLNSCTATTVEAKISGSGDIAANSCNFQKTKEKISGSGRISGF